MAKREIPEPWQILSKKLSLLESVDSFNEPCLTTTYERLIYSDIKNGMTNFDLEQYANKTNLIHLHNARVELLLQGQIIVMLRSDAKHNGFPNIPNGKNNLISITYQYYRIPWLKHAGNLKDETKLGASYKEEAWKEQWIESYNDYIKNYLIKVYHSISYAIK